MRQGKCVKKGTSAELIHSIVGCVGERRCTKEELAGLQQEYRTGNIFQRQDGLRFRIVENPLPQEFEPVKEGLSLEEVYLYYLGRDSGNE